MIQTCNHRSIQSSFRVFQSLRKFTSAQPDVKPVEFYRTNESDPINHTTDHLARFYTVPSPVFDRLHKFTGAFEPQANEMFKIFGETCLMVRKPALEVMDYLNRTDFSKPVNRFVLYGRYGNGKTFTLNHIAHFGSNKKFLLIHPTADVSKWFHHPQEFTPSESRPGRYDLPLDSALWLQQFKAVNAALLAELDLKVSKKYTWSLREETEEGEPLMNVIDHGISRIKHASDCVAVLLKELKTHTTEGKMKSLFICDNASCFYRRTLMRHPDSTEVEVDNITIGRAFKKLFHNDWKNGAVVVSVGSKPYISKDWLHGDGRGWKFKSPEFPKEQLTEDGFKDFDPFVPIEVTKYSDVEIESCLDYYRDRNFLLREPSKSEIGRNEIKFLSGYNPKELYKICTSM